MHDWSEDWKSDVTLKGSPEMSQLFMPRQNLTYRSNYIYVGVITPSQLRVCKVLDDEPLEFYENEMSRGDREVLDRHRSAYSDVVSSYFQHRMPEVIKRLLAPTEQLSD